MKNFLKNFLFVAAFLCSITSSYATMVSGNIFKPGKSNQAGATFKVSTLSSSAPGNLAAGIIYAYSSTDCTIRTQIGPSIQIANQTPGFRYTAGETFYLTAEALHAAVGSLSPAIHCVQIQLKNKAGIVAEGTRPCPLFDHVTCNATTCSSPTTNTIDFGRITTDCTHN